MNPLEHLRNLKELFLSNPADLIRFTNQSSNDAYLEYYRACKDLMSSLPLQICMSYDFTNFQVTGNHEYRLELFTWGIF